MLSEPRGGPTGFVRNADNPSFGASKRYAVNGEKSTNQKPSRVHREWVKTGGCLNSHASLPIGRRLLPAPYERTLDGSSRGVGQVRHMFMPNRAVVNQH